MRSVWCRVLVDKLRLFDVMFVVATFKLSCFFLSIEIIEKKLLGLSFTREWEGL